MLALVVPAHLGAGIRLFGDLAEGPIELENPTVVEGNGVTHLHYAVLKAEDELGRANEHKQGALSEYVGDASGAMLESAGWHMLPRRDPAHQQGTSQWAVPGSNRRPPACKESAGAAGP